MVRMISGSTRIGKRTYTPADGFFEAAPEAEQRLVLLGVAEYDAETASEPVATDAVPASGDAPGVDMPSEENGAESDAAAHLDAEQFQTLTVAQLKAMAEEMGIATAKLKKKGDLIAAITAVSVEPGTADEDTPPALGLEAPIV